MTTEVKDQVQGMVQLDPQALIQSALDQGADIDKLERLIALAKDVRAEIARAAWYKAMAEFQEKGTRIMKSKRANMGKFSFDYAPLDEILSVVQPVMGPLGLSISFRLIADQSNEKQVTYIARIVHALGHHEDSGPVTIPITQGGVVAEEKGANPAQRVGIAHSYSKRYAALAILGIAPEDDENAPPRSSGSNGSGVRQPQRTGAEPSGESDETVWTGKVSKVEEKSGTTNGKPWTIFTVVGTDGKRFGTFDKNVAAFAREAGSSEVRIEFEKTDRGNLNITGIDANA
jgi:ERF superfamily